MERKKILIFDSWSIGMNYTSGLAEVLDKYNVCYLHMDSLQKQSSKNVTEKIKVFKNDRYKTYYKLYDEVYDIKEYDFSVLKAIEEIKPDLMVFISLHNFEQRYVNEIASKKNIPSIMFMHGVRGEAKDFNLNISGVKDLASKLKRGVHYLKLYYYYLLDLKSVEKIDFKLHLDRIYKLIFKHRLFVEFPKKDRGIKYKALFVTNESDINYYEKNYGLSNKETNFILIGHVDFHELIKGLTNKRTITKDNLLFISQPLVRDVGFPKEEFINALKINMNLAKELNLNFILRPHPRDDFDFIKELNNKMDFQISNNDLHLDLVGSKLISGFNSTVLLSAQYLGKPLIIIDSNHINIPDFLKSYDKTVLIKNGNIEKIDIDVIKEYLSNYKELDIDELVKKDPVHIIKESINEILCLD